MSFKPYDPCGHREEEIIKVRDRVATVVVVDLASFYFLPTACHTLGSQDGSMWQSSPVQFRFRCRQIFSPGRQGGPI